MSALVQECRNCRSRLFPDRLFCPVCGGDSFSTVAVGQGTVEQTTALPDGSVLATLSIDGGLRVIARLTGSGAQPGQDVPLTNDPHAASGVTAFIPVPSNLNEDQP
ncbi:putative OB-fold protein [Pseudarthrobacter sp. W1I19]|uniref:zinc ribbon domain-containing protein n=1 Tax=Pseudarthrobacter sp. W1I19 TaxID=3042288 RepID=UPI002784812F|nr:zinc ribbon domain-containing protein [Pseudarthrobacter sp. W1I19]MDQ0923762.1 putative OB-fold protein [Pseudarthrobacter sp. W1I19]